MSITIDNISPAPVTTIPNAASLTSGSFTPPEGALLAVAVQANVNRTMTQPSNTGGTVAWDAAAAVEESANNCLAGIWLGKVTTSASMTVTCNLNEATSYWGFFVTVVTGQANAPKGQTQVATAAAGTPAVPSATISSLDGANSLIMASIQNESNNTHPSVPAGQSTTWGTQTSEWDLGAGTDAGWTQYLTGMNLSAGAEATINDTAPSANYSMAMLEILASVGTPDVTTLTLAIG